MDLSLLLDIAKVIIWPALGVIYWLLTQVFAINKKIDILEHKVQNLPNHEDNKKLLIAVEQLDAKFGRLDEKINSIKEAVTRHEDVIKESR